MEALNFERSGVFRAAFFPDPVYERLDVIPRFQPKQGQMRLKAARLGWKTQRRQLRLELSVQPPQGLANIDSNPHNPGLGESGKHTHSTHLKRKRGDAFDTPFEGGANRLDLRLVNVAEELEG